MNAMHALPSVRRTAAVLAAALAALPVHARAQDADIPMQQASDRGAIRAVTLYPDRAVRQRAGGGSDADRVDELLVRLERGPVLGEVRHAPAQVAHAPGERG
ncbi:MAG: hypothetical protein ACKOTD_13450, partial [Phycisphaerales bacterium]